MGWWEHWTQGMCELWGINRNWEAEIIKGGLEARAKRSSELLVGMASYDGVTASHTSDTNKIKKCLEF